MSQVVIETDSIKKGVLYFFAIVGIAIIGCWIGMGIVDHYISEEVQQAVASASTPVTAPVIAPVTASTSTVASPVQQYPYIIEFTVLSTTIANGHYTVFTTAGQTLYISDFSSWNSCYPQNTYSATITGVEVNGALDASAVNLIYRIYYPPVTYPVSYPWYYYYSGMYYRYDGLRTTQVASNQVTGQRVINGQPPNWNRV
ncbi:hypothetical protein [Methanoregula sp.]|uniref:hypothetical protein n=1 Tax=Methanoregula sp. TaxID=2052170 RepID=UPI002C561619|nr:hypothetical protein [Methanoregula sp.]HVP96808.1 hypothetical protein [Methanoregula sp.]